MSHPPIPTQDKTHSFVIRLWQELPGKWRGTIRHVQSDRQRAISSPQQAAQFVERVTQADEPVMPLSEPTRVSKPGLNWARPTPKFAFALAAVLFVVLIGVAALNNTPLTVTPGTAMGDSNTFMVLGVFAVGFALGGVVIWFLTRDS